jgi:hypothetical protein
MKKSYKENRVGRWVGALMVIALLAGARLANAAAHGAVGAMLDSLAMQQIHPFKERVSDLAFPDMRWLEKKGQPNDYFPELRGAVFLSREATARVFQGSGKSLTAFYFPNPLIVKEELRWG